MKWKPEPPALLSLPCTGHMSEPKQDCDRRIDVLFPFNLGRLTSELKRVGWFVTAVSEQGVNPPVMSILCGDCAEAIIPELVEATRKVWKERDS